VRNVVAAARLARACLHVAHGMAIVKLRFASLPVEQREQRIQWWSAKLLRLLGLHVQMQVQPRVPGGAPLRESALVVCNHVSWLDNVAIHAVLPQACFVSKADVLRWPLVGDLVAGAGTLFIERESKRDALRVVHRVTDALRERRVVAVFPEGTTSEGRDVRPFHANMLQAAVSSGVPVQPLVLRFADDNGELSEAAMYVGETTLMQSAWRLACQRRSVVQVRVLEPIPVQGLDRRAAARLAHEAISSSLRGDGGST
jgi:1-acyl-sn-glycerol-3-phosphate acyltransferase